MSRLVWLVIAGVLVSACGASAQRQSQGRKNVLVYQDPPFLDGTPIPGDSIVRKLYCGTRPDALVELELPDRRILLADVIAQGLPYDTLVYCVGTAEVAGVEGARGNQVEFYCKQAGPNVVCFGS